MRIIITTVQVPMLVGGAEYHAKGLKSALESHGHEVDIVAIPFHGNTPETIAKEMFLFQMFDVTSYFNEKTDLVIGLRFPAYLIPHPNKILWVIHQHRPAYDFWDIGLSRYPFGEEIRQVILKQDQVVSAEAKHVFANSENVARRLKHFCNINSKVLYHPPPFADQYYFGGDDGYLFFPSRIASLKRHSLVIQALAKTRESVVIKIAGTAFRQHYFQECKQLAIDEGVADRIIWLGHISEEEKRSYYANATGVIFPPYDEDYGYITLEAMLASKPVITCTDSGGPLEFITHRDTGLVAEPDPDSLAAAMDELWQQRSKATEWGKNARQYYDSLNLSWDHVVRNLLA